MPGYTHPHPEAIYYHIAKDSLEKAKAEKDIFTKKQHVVTSLVFSATCLEAFINQSYWHCSETRELINENDNMSLETKWLDLPKLIGGSETFVKGIKPYQDFKALVRLRNVRLVHFKPGKEHRSSSGEPYKEEYVMKVLENVELCEKYFKCVEAMIKKLNELTQGKTGIPGFIKDGRRTSSKLLSYWSL